MKIRFQVECEVSDQDNDGYYSELFNKMKPKTHDELCMYLREIHFFEDFNSSLEDGDILKDIVIDEEE